MIELKNKMVLVTGGTGMLGRAVCKILLQRQAQISTVSSKEYDLRDWGKTWKLFNELRPDYLIHLAGFNGGINFNKENPSTIFHYNTLMALNVLEAARKSGVEKTLSTLTSCAYPGNSPDVLEEKDFWNGPCHPTVECHGLAKRNIEAYSRFLNKQHDIHHDKSKFGIVTDCYIPPANFITVAITNLYGPHDNFTERGKVVSNLIRKFVQAKVDKAERIIMMGTGIAKRDLLYVEDAAELVVRALERYEDRYLPLNIGSGSEVSIKELAETISKIVGLEGEIVWTGGEDGQLRKLLDITRMKNILEWEPQISLQDGLEKTINWYTKNKQEIYH